MCMCKIVLFVIGLWFDLIVLFGGGKFFWYVVFYYSGVFVFLIGDIFFLFGIGMLIGM